jgi:hypothetical protein
LKRVEERQEGANTCPSLPPSVHVVKQNDWMKWRVGDENEKNGKRGRGKDTEWSKRRAAAAVFACLFACVRMCVCASVCASVCVWITN